MRTVIGPRYHYDYQLLDQMLKPKTSNNNDTNNNNNIKNIDKMPSNKATTGQQPPHTTVSTAHKTTNL